MRNIILLTIIGLTILSCSKDNNPDPELIGRWIWEGSSGGIAGITETPESTGDNRELDISADSIKSYLNGTLNFQTAYSTETRESVIFNEPREMVIQENGFRQIIEFSGGKLILIGDCYDCYISEYIKE
ncbi:hypothetical protein RM549_08890 [Salegentibacter sp. F188]|uniref:Lipocalin-like domain-containing protein n=1 Tax=Autumnicola patrickiae TaxID=3075591 RepID=A0ABU3E1M6_9FLAO|nr:hypothetical protein [Salegentibacter sp. F188]MDT0689900.1 hypothetical protein [Salegentibacter sp. F188]